MKSTNLSNASSGIEAQIRSAQLQARDGGQQAAMVVEAAQELNNDPQIVTKVNTGLTGERPERLDTPPGANLDISV